MSSRYGVPVVYFCDKAKCDKTLDTGKTLAIDAENSLYAAGWSTSHRGDFCPKHTNPSNKGD